MNRSGHRTPGLLVLAVLSLAVVPSCGGGSSSPAPPGPLPTVLGVAEMRGVEGG